MKAERINRLIAALGQPAYEQAKNTRAPSQPSESKSTVQQSADAVKIAVTLRSNNVPGAEEDSNSGKVAALKAQVEAGIYRPPSKEIAVKLVQELGI